MARKESYPNDIHKIVSLSCDTLSRYIRVCGDYHVSSQTPFLDCYNNKLRFGFDIFCYCPLNKIPFPIKLSERLPPVVHIGVAMETHEFIRSSMKETFDFVGELFRQMKDEVYRTTQALETLRIGA